MRVSWLRQRQDAVAIAGMVIALRRIGTPLGDIVEASRRIAAGDCTARITQHDPQHKGVELRAATTEMAPPRIGVVKGVRDPDRAQPRRRTMLFMPQARRLDSRDRKAHNHIVSVHMKCLTPIAAAIIISSGLLLAQETKPVPKDSVRVAVPGCSKGYIFTAGRRTQDEPGSGGVPDGMHLRMNGPKQMIADIKAHEGSMIELTGLMKKGQLKPDGVSIGGGVRVSPGASPNGGSIAASPGVSQIMIDVEGWRPITGNCPS